jgi:hypothetical protein
MPQHRNPDTQWRPDDFQRSRKLAAVLYWQLADLRDQPFTIPLLLVSAFAVRMLSIYGRTTLTGGLSQVFTRLWKPMPKWIFGVKHVLVGFGTGVGRRRRA